MTETETANEQSARARAETDPLPEPPPALEARTLGLLVGLLTLGLIDNQILSPILTEIASDLRTSAAAVGRTVAVYALCAAGAALSIAPLSDRWGRRVFLIAAGVVFSLGSALVVTAGSILQFSVARGITGAAAGVLSALVVASIADRVPYADRGRAMGWVAVAYFAAPILGVPAASWLAERYHWRLNYFIFAVAGLALALAILVFFDRSRPRQREKPDRRSYLDFFSNRSTAAGALSAFFITGSVTGFLLFLGAYLRARFELSITQVGMVFFLSGVASLFGALAAGRVSDREGKLPVALGGCIALSVTLILVPFLSGPLLYGILGMVGLAAAARVAPLQSLVTQLVSEEARGSYVALRNTLSQCGNATAATLAAGLYQFGFGYICAMAAAFSFAAFILLLLIEEPTG